MADPKRAPRKTDALNDRAATLIAQGMFADAMKACIRSLRVHETERAKALFVRLIKPDPRPDDPSARPYLIRALTDAWCRTGQLVPASFALIKSNPAVGECIQRAVSSWPTRLSPQELFGTAGLAACADDDLLIAVLESTPAAGLEFEHFLTLARHALLVHIVRATAPEHVDGSAFRLGCALARQCFINEYVYECTPEEGGHVASLGDAIEKRIVEAQAAPRAWLAAFACYRPLVSLHGCERLTTSASGRALSGLLSQQVKEPLRERACRATLPKLTAITDAISLQVTHQYEKNPYPRWVRSPSVNAETFSEFLQQELGVEASRFAGRLDAADVLVAGCGTGQQSIQTARKLPSARILAVDLSVSSLAYAACKTRELGMSNIEYAQADILELASIGKTFDLIQCVGVLHHLADPVAGWRVLRSLLRPGGVMQVGLYSEIARSRIAAAQKLIVEQDYESTTEGIRRFRVDLQSLGRWRPFRNLVAIEDFYDTSGCRDLFFHVKEHRFTLPQIKRCLAELDLEFVQLNVEPAVQERFSARFPGELARSDLNSWTQFEVENPSTFLGMYNFYARRRA